MKQKAIAELEMLVYLLDNLTQDFIYNYGVKSLNPVKRIFKSVIDSVIDFSKAYDFVKSDC
ncbi:MAG: hypothetical protein ACP5UA_03320 [Candidatus Hydrogenedens sp.]